MPVGEPLPPTAYPDVRRVETKRGHHYVCDGRRVRNVTTIIGGAVPKDLTRWAARLAAQSAWELLRADVGLSQDEVVRAAAGASDGVRDGAAARGTAVHALAERMLRGELVDPGDLQPWADGVERFLDDTGWRTVVSEVVVWNDDPVYAGTVDALLEDERGRLILVDLKTSKGVYPEMVLQLAAYRHAKWMRIGDSVYRMPQVFAAGLVHLPGNGSYEYWAANTSGETFDVFCAVHQVSGWLARKKEEVLERWDVTSRPTVGEEV